MDHQERDESSCLTMTEAFSIVSLSFLCGASLIISIPAVVAGIQKYYVKEPDLRLERLMVYLACGACVTSALGCLQWVSYFAAHSHTARLICSVQSYVWLMVATFYFMFMLSFGIHFFAFQKWKQPTLASRIPLHTQPVISRKVEITCVCISLVVTGTVVPFAKYIFGSNLSICWRETITNSFNIPIGRGLDVMMPNVAILGVVLFSVCIIVVLLTCVSHEKRLSLDFYGWTFLVASISIVFLISILNPIGSKPVKIMILSYIPANSSFVSIASLKFKQSINNHLSPIVQGGPSKQQNSFQFHKDDQDIRETVKNTCSIIEICKVELTKKKAGKQ